MFVACTKSKVADVCTGTQTATRGPSAHSPDPLQTSCDLSQFSSSQLEKCIVMLC